MCPGESLGPAIRVIPVDGVYYGRAGWGRLLLLRMRRYGMEIAWNRHPGGMTE